MNIPEPQPGLVPPPEVVAAVARQLGRPREWVEMLYQLSVPEFRRALRAIPPQLDRHPGEEAYPTTGWLGQYLLYCQEMEAPLGWHFWCGVSLLGVVARRNFYIDRSRYFLYLHHFILILGPSGLTKSTTMSQADDVFRVMHKAAKGDNGLGIDQVYRAPDRITTQKLLEDVHRWTKVGDSRRDTILYLINDELATLVGKAVKGSDNLADFITAMYTKGSYKDSTVSGKERELENGTMNCLFATTPSSMRRNITEGLFAEGFMGRTITVSRDYRDRHGIFATPPPADPVMCRQLGLALVPWLMLDREMEVRPSDETREWMDDWYADHITRAPNDEKLVAFWMRKQDHCYKLAAILTMSEAIADGPEKHRELVIELPTMELALRLLELEESRLAEAFAQVGAREEAQDIYRLQTYIERKFAETHQPIAHSTIYHGCRHFIKDAKHLREMEDTLLEAGAIEIGSGPGRKFVPKGK